MSFIEDLQNRKRQNMVLTPQAESIPINLPEAHSGLAGSYREPYRVNGPLNSAFAPSNRSRMQMIPKPTYEYRG